ncbi:hypothetical protein BN2537_9193 [Streptomyces venezuelae]|nr:hypothetical protein BN2537_9193 [Streptomyces venezuelae]
MFAAMGGVPPAPSHHVLGQIGMEHRLLITRRAAGVVRR